MRPEKKGKRGKFAIAARRAEILLRQHDSRFARKPRAHRRLAAGALKQVAHEARVAEIFALQHRVRQCSPRNGGPRNGRPAGSRGPRPSSVPERTYAPRDAESAAPVAPKRTERVDDFADFSFGKIEL